MTKDEVLRLALEALEECEIPWPNTRDVKVTEAITAIKAALKAKDEPVAWEQFYPDIGKNQFAYLPPSPFSISGKPQSSQQEANEFNPDWDTQAVLVEEIQRMAKRIEELEAKDEPVAWLHKETGLLRKETISSKGADWDENHWKPLYTTPSQRTWVALTKDELNKLLGTYIGRKLAQAIEAKLKEKNYD